MDRWRIEAKERVYQTLTDIFIFRHGLDGQIDVLIPKGTDSVEEKSLPSDAVIPPALTIHSHLAPLLMDALKRNGTKLPDESYTAGKLQATESHLKDLRQLLKLK